MSETDEKPWIIDASRETWSDPEGVPQHDRIEGLCDQCSKCPWDDVSKMSLCKSLRYTGIPRSTLTCPMCRLFRALQSLQKGSRTIASSRVSDLQKLGFESFQTDSVCCLGSNLYFDDNIFHEATFLISQLDHGRVVSLLQNYYPEEACLESAGAWIAQCELEHSASCLLQDPPRLQNLRVIDCKERRVVAAPPSCKFVALSYVWGDSTSSKAESGGSLPQWHLLPRTIQQCVQVTCDLGYRFLWVDRYDNPEDQITQINQMGDIYAAAHLTVIAAAGEDPSYGLPGISPTIRQFPEHEKIGYTWIYVLPRIRGLQVALSPYTSKWVTRAWTFQEGFFSRRRLIFTDRQMIFVCNTYTRYEVRTDPMVKEDDIWLRRCIPRSHTPASDLDSLPMSRAQSYLSGYSDRILKFDDDALNAIGGALNTLSREHLYHIWGVPFHYGAPDDIPKPNTSSCGSRGEISLSWYSDFFRYRDPDLNYRRWQFPSWSSLGWKFKVGFGYPANVCNVSMQTDQGQISLQDLVPGSGIISADCSRRLRLDLATANFHVVRPENNNDNFMYHCRVALCYQNNTYVYFDTVWDVSPDCLPNTSTIKGILMPLSRQSRSSLLPGSAYVLLLQPHGQYYERVGFVWLTLYDRPTAHPVEEGYKYKGHVCKFLNDPDIEQTDWWKKHFTKETIILV